MLGLRTAHLQVLAIGVLPISPNVLSLVGWIFQMQYSMDRMIMSNSNMGLLMQTETIMVPTKPPHQKTLRLRLVRCTNIFQYFNSQTGASALMCSRTLVAFLPPSGVADPPPIRFFQDSDRILILCLPKFADTIHALLMF